MAESDLLRTASETVKMVLSLSPRPEPVVNALDNIVRLANRETKALADARQELLNTQNAYVAMLRLFDQLQVSKVIEAIGEIVTTFIGSEDYVLHLRSKGEWEAVAGMGEVYRAVGKAGRPPVDLLAAQGGADPCFRAPDWVALSTLIGEDGQPVGFMSIKRLLWHKPRLSFGDRELVGLLRTKGGLALSVALARGVKPP